MTPNFPDRELACKCGCGMLPEKDFMQKVQALREAFGGALPVTSAARCPTYNMKVSSSGPEGPHTTGRAIDFSLRGQAAYKLLSLAFAHGFTGIGVQQKGASRFIHLDDLQHGGRPSVWSY